MFQKRLNLRTFQKVMLRSRRMIKLGIDDFIKERTELILWIASIITGMYIFGEGNILSYDTSKYKFVVVGLVVLNLYISIKLYKALMAEKLKGPEIRYVEKPKEGQPFDKPFNFEVRR